MQKHWPLAVIFTIWFVVFFQMNTCQTVVGYRDSAYLYYPYFQWIDQQWQNGEIPLWNPYCDLGYPVVADGTSSVFYPGKLIFLLRFLSYPSRYGLYLSLHVLWAAITAYVLAFRMGSSNTGSGIAGFSYAFGGSVLFQTTNVVYLVSASWLPLGILAIANMFKCRKLSPAIRLAIVSSMMVLGGDPQMAYVIAVLAVSTWSFHLVWNRKRYRTWKPWLIKLAFGVGQILIFALVAFGLSAIQVLPTYVWSQQSLRTQEQLSVGKMSLEPAPGTHLHAVYEFSQPPWTVLEMMLPNVYGKPFPEDCRWANSFPGADRIWNPSLYIGLMTCVFAFGSISLFGKSRRKNWLTWIAAVFCLASFGWYGLSWAIKECMLMNGLQIDSVLGNIGSQVGGIYWLMTIALPEFDSFRYPAKLFVVASLAISVLAGGGISKPLQNRRVLLGVGLSGLIVVLAWICTDSIAIHLHDKYWEKSSHELFGPFCNSQWRWLYYGMLAHAAIMTMLIAAAVLSCRFRKLSPATLGNLLFVVLVVDILLANSWLLVPVDSSVFVEPVEIVQATDTKNSAGRLRLWRVGSTPGAWKDVSSKNRLAEIVRWQRRSLHPKHHLTLPDSLKFELLNSFTSIEHGRANDSRKGALRNLWDSMFVDRLVNGQVGFESKDQKTKLGILFQNHTQFCLAEPSTLDSKLDMMNSIYKARNAEFELLGQEENSFSIQVDCDKHVILLCNMLPDPGWCVYGSDDGGFEFKVVKKDVGPFFLAVEVPAGKSTIEFRYSPFEFWLGLWVSSASWIGLGVFSLFKLWRR